MTVYNLEQILLSILGQENLEKLMNEGQYGKVNTLKISPVIDGTPVDLNDVNYADQSEVHNVDKPMVDNPLTDFEISSQSVDLNQDYFTDTSGNYIDDLAAFFTESNNGAFAMNENLAGYQTDDQNSSEAHDDPYQQQPTKHQNEIEHREDISPGANIPTSDMATALIRVPFGFGAYAQDKSYKKTSFAKLEDSGIISLAVINLLYKLYGKHKNNAIVKSMTGNDWEFYMNFMLGLHDKVYGLSFLYWCDANEEYKTKYLEKTGKNISDVISESREGFIKLSGIEIEEYEQAVKDFKSNIVKKQDNPDWKAKELFFPSDYTKIESYIKDDNTHGKLEWFVNNEASGKLKPRLQGITNGIYSLLSGELTREQLAADYNLSFQKIEDTQTEQETYEHVLNSTGPEAFPAVASIDDLKKCRQKICGTDPDKFNDKTKTLRKDIQKAFKKFYGDYKENEDFQPGSFVLVNKAFVDLAEGKSETKTLFSMIK